MSNTITCPVCKSEDTKDASIREDNGVMGPGYASWVVEEKHQCNACGIYFKPIDVFNKKTSESAIIRLRIFLKLQRQSVTLNLEQAKNGLINSITVSRKDKNGISMAEWGDEVMRNQAQLDFISFLYEGFPELKYSNDAK